MDKIIKVEHFLNMQSDSDNLTWREWLKTVLGNLLSEGESFDSKRPMGYSGWERTLHENLKSCGIELSDLIHYLFNEEKNNGSIR